MTREQADFVKGKCRVIAINDQGIDTVCDGKPVPALAPWADVLYAADWKWWNYHKAKALKFAGMKVSVQAKSFPEVLNLEISKERTLDPKPTHLVTGANSGYQAIHLAYHFGATKILLLGYDMKHKEKRKHWFGNHPGVLNTPQAFPTWIQAFNRLAPELAKRGVSVINCTPDSALKCFPKAELSETLK